MAMSPAVNFVNVPVDFKVVQCRLSNLRKGCVVLSNLRVKGPNPQLLDLCCTNRRRDRVGGRGWGVVLNLLGL